MSTASLYVKLTSLPSDLKKELIDFMDFLLQKRKRERQGREGIPGLAKGRIIVADDFDAPLEDFKPYME
jgi:Protein of unknown function (DUF2281)